ncbi:MAG: VCBS repeat-containing protein, partial [Bacteroidetes bacterium]|nr:VCBS repeat-containing protein [Bacteroidota bacterium]
DFDNDGDLDVVVNNLEDEPFLYQNLTIEHKTPNANYLSFKLKGAPGNRNAIGAKVVVFKKQEKIIVEHFPVRGYQSSALANLHVGVGDTATVDSVLLIWPDLSYERLPNAGYNRVTAPAWRSGLPRFDFNILKNKKAALFAFSDLSEATGLNHRHVENQFVEFNREALIPHMVSSEGPALAVGDVNGDGLEDVFFGSAKRRFSALYLQKPGGTFFEKTPDAILSDSLMEDVDAVFADVDNDGDLDLAIAAGGNEYQGTQDAMKQRYYRNDGKGNFQRIDFQGVYMTASCILPADFNKDGLVDFFLGARAVPWNYGITPSSALMLNKGNGRFENILEKTTDGLKDAGLVKHGAWADMDADGDPDLVLAIEWEPITVFLNNNGIFEKKPINDLSGWWNFVLPHDFDGDGDLDLLAGNLGENAKFKPTKKEPLRMYVADFDDNGQIEQILTYYLKGKEIPFANYAGITKQMPSLKKRYLYAKDFAKATLAELFGSTKLANSIHREVNTLQSMYFENKGNWQFEPHPLPDVLQFSTLNSAALAGDGKKEVLLGGTFFDCMVEMGRYDANFGNVLSISAGGKMEVSPLGGLLIEGQVRRIVPVKAGGQQLFILAKNNEAAQVIRPVPAIGQSPTRTK